MSEQHPDTASLREAVAGIWCEALGVAHAEAQDDFFLEGGDSALAVETAFSLRAIAGPELGLDILYRHPRFGQLLDALTEPRPQPERRPLTPAEERLWVAERLHPGTPQYNIAALYRFTGSIDVPRLRTALAALVTRHPALRRGFEPPGHAVTADRAEATCRWVDGRDVPAPALRELIDEQAARPFDLAAPPLLRALVVDRGEEGDLLLLTVHHLVCDGGSIAILEDDLSRLYTDGAPELSASDAPPLPSSVAAQTDGSSGLPDEQESRAYWRRVLADCPRTLTLPHDLPRPAAPDNTGAVHTAVCPEDLRADMDKLAAEEALSPFMTWVIAYVAGLAALSGQRDLVIGIASSSRTRAQRGEIGMFADPLPLRLRLPAQSTARDLARQVRRAATEALAYRGASLHTIIEDLGPGGDPARMPLVQAGLSYLDVSGCALRFDKLEARRELLPTGTAKYELIWVVTRQAERTLIELEYLSGLFSAAKAGETYASIMQAARAAFAHPDAALHIPDVTSPVAEPSLAGPSAGAEPRRPLPELVRQWAEQRPDTPAVRHHETELTYRQLHDRALAVAAGLQEAGLRRGAVVAVPIKRSADSITAYLGIHYAGCAYLPLDPDLAADRIRTTVEGVADAALVTGPQPPGLPQQLPVLRLERLLAGPDALLSADADAVTDSAAATAPATDPASSSALPSVPPADPPVSSCLQFPVPITGEDAAYLMSTSGSTGRPKTVVVPHRAISRLVPNAEGITIDSADRVAHVCNPAFDAATLEIWGALGAGALLVIGDKHDVLSPARLRAFLDEHRISVLGLPTALLNTVIDVAPDALAGIRLLVFGGEKADEGRLAKLLAHRPPGRIVNVYGPTENTTVSTLQAVTPDALRPGPLPIGRCISGSTAYVLGPDGAPAAPGTEGELYVGGDGLAHGYHANPALTAASFVPDPFDPRGGRRLYRTGDRVRSLADGTFHFVGRNDDQVKVRGYRVELGEIEHALRALPALADAAVLARPTPDGLELIACVVPADAAPTPTPAPLAPLPSSVPAPTLIPDPDPGSGSGAGDLDLAALAAALRTRLPDYMIPAFVLADRLPLNANGKVDRAALLASLPRHIPRPRGLDQDPDAPPQTPTAPSPTDPAKPAAPSELSASADPLAEIAASLWCESLGVDRALPEDNFIALGGHSIKALKLLARIEDKLGVAVDLAYFLADPTLRALTAAIADQAGGQPEG